MPPQIAALARLRASPSSSAARTAPTASPTPTTIVSRPRCNPIARLGRQLSHHRRRGARTSACSLPPCVPPRAPRASSGTRRGDNPYPAFLAHADRFIVTADSVNMTGEPCATGRPVWVFQPSGGSAKFERFHASLRRYGATRPLPDTVTTLETWELRSRSNSATRIAREIERRWLARRRMLSGLIGPVDRHPQ